MVSALMLMKVSKGGIGLPDILDFYIEDFEGWMDAAEDVEKRLSEAARR